MKFDLKKLQEVKKQVNQNNLFKKWNAHEAYFECPKCGRKFKGDVKHCSECGTKLEFVEADEGLSYEDAIRITSAKFCCWCLEFDDLYSELTLFLLKRVEEYGGWQDYRDCLDDSLEFTFKILKNKAIDIYRKARSEWDQKAELIDEIFEGDDAVAVSSIGTPEEAYQNILQTQFRDTYPVMSRPWIYVTLKLAACGMIAESELAPYGLYLPKYGNKTNTGAQYDIKDVDIIAQMGFKSSRPSSYYTMKTEIKEELLRFLEGQNAFEL